MSMRGAAFVMAREESVKGSNALFVTSYDATKESSVLNLRDASVRLTLSLESVDYLTKLLSSAVPTPSPEATTPE